MQKWPSWWEWELERTPHVIKRMRDRAFNELDLRTMIERAKSYKPDDTEGRWVIIAGTGGMLLSSRIPISKGWSW